MKKKSLLFTLSLAIAAQMPVTYATEQYTVSYDAVTEKIYVEGVGEPRSSISLEVLFPGKTDEDANKADVKNFEDIIYRVDQTSSDSSGRYSFVFEMDDMPTGDYLTLINGEAGGYIYYVSSTEVSKLVTEINEAADENDIQKALSENANVFGEMGTYFEKLSREEQLEISKAILTEREKMSGKLFTKIEQISSVFNETTLISALNNSPADINKKSLLEAGESILKLKELSVYSYYSDLSDFEKEAVANKVAASKPESVSDITRVFTEQTVLSRIKITRAEQLEALLKEYKDIFDIDYSDYNKLSSYRQLQVLQKVAGKEYADAAEVKNAFYGAVEDFETVNNSGGVSAGGGGGGGSDGAIKIIPAMAAANSIAAGSVQPSGKVFSDLLGYEWAEESITSLFNKGIINGKGNGMFYPGDNVKREEFVKIIVEALSSGSDSGSNVFSDVDEAMWYAPYVNKAYLEGWVNGVSEDKFGVGDNITRQDMATILWRIAKLKEAALPQNKSIGFTDEGMISDYAKEAIAVLAGAGIINGNPDGSFAPQSNATRAETAKLVYAFLQYCN